MNNFKIGDFAILHTTSIFTKDFKINELVKIVNIDLKKYEFNYEIENNYTTGFCNFEDLSQITDIKISNIIFSKNGNGFISPKLNLSYTKLKEMGINENEKRVSIIYNKDEIIIRKENKNE